MRRPLILAFAALALAASPGMAGTNGIHIHQLALRCRSGSRTLAYVELQADATGATFDASVGWTIMDSKGATLFDAPHMFGSATNSAWTLGKNWLLAGSVFRAITGVLPDGPMNATPDTTGGSVIVYSLGADGVTRTTLDRLDYGVAAGHPVPLGAALTRQGDLSWAVDWVPRPRNLTNGAPDLVTCFGDSIPMPAIRRFATMCEDGSGDGAFLELTPLARNITFDSGLHLTMYDHTGALLANAVRPFGINTDRAWTRNRSFLLAGPGFTERTGMTPDAALPTRPDPLGGVIDLSASAGPITQHRRLHYGPGGNLPPLAPGRGVLGTTDSSFVDDPRMAAADLTGEALDPGACFALFAADSCPFCATPVPSPTCAPTYAPLSLASGNEWNANALAANHVSFYDYETHEFQGSISSQYDLTRGFLKTTATHGFGVPIRVNDDFVLLGPTAAPAQDLVLRITLQNDLGHAIQPTVASSMSVGYLDSLTTPLVQNFTGDTTSVQVLAEPLRVVVGAPFHVSYSFEPGHTAGGQGGITQLTFSVDGLPAGFALVSCHGFFQQGTAVVATQVASASAAATPGRAELSWRVLQPASTALTVQRSRDGVGWTDLATAVADGDGRVEFADTNVQTGARYGYRLRWSDIRTGMQTGGEVWADIPAGYRFAIHRVSPNPSHGNVAIGFEIAEPGAVRVELIDVAGRCVASRVLASLAAGTHTVPITPTDALPPGVYMARIRAGAHLAQSRVIVIR